MIFNGFASDLNERTESEWVTLQEAAATLSVSPATIRNWVKSGKITRIYREDTAIRFSREELQKLKREIESGESHRLKSRRNKRAVKGNIIATEYVESQEYIRITEQILEIIKKARGKIDIRLILLETVLKLIFNKRISSDASQVNTWQVNSYGKSIIQEGEYLSKQTPIQYHEKPNEPSLTELASQRQLDGIDVYETLLLELWNYKDFPIPESHRDVLRAIRRLSIPWIQGEDLLGLVYMALSNLGIRKRRGSYYTPVKLVDTLVQKSFRSISNLSFPRVIDPCCGSGNFLIKLFLALVEKAETKGVPRQEAEKEVLAKSLHGFELDPIAAVLAKLNLALLLEVPSSSEAPAFLYKLNCINSLIQCKNALISGENIVSSNSFDSDRASDFTVRQYDLVIGNPPWGYDYTKQEMDSYRKTFISAQTSKESFSLFIEYGIRILREGGVLAYVLPEALLNVKIHSAIRKWLLERVIIEEIRLLGQAFSKVFAPTITFMARKQREYDPEALEPLPIQPSKTIQPLQTVQALQTDLQGTGLKRLKNLEGQRNEIRIILENGTYFIPQKRFYKNQDYIFNMKTSSAEEEILEHMRTLPGAMSLAGNADFALGIVTGNNREFVLNHRTEGSELVLKGNDVFRYNVYPKENYLRFKPEKFQQVAPVELYRVPEKLIYRFINENLVFAYDDQQTLSLNSANLVIPRLDGYSMKYILAILNSRAAQFFYSASFSSVKVLRKHIESIPIPPCDFATQRQLVQQVDLLIHSDNKKERIEYYEQIDEQIMNLYALSPVEQEVIWGKFKEVKYIGLDDHL